jgi:hypothetical protein
VVHDRSRNEGKVTMKTLLILTAVSLAVPAYSESIASFRGDERHSGIYQGAGVPVLHGLKWKFTTNGPVVSTPAVVGNAAYIGSNDHWRYSLVGRDTHLRQTRFAIARHVEPMCHQIRSERPGSAQLRWKCLHQRLDKVQRQREDDD